MSSKAIKDLVGNELLSIHDKINPFFNDTSLYEEVDEMMCPGININHNDSGYLTSIELFLLGNQMPLHKYAILFIDSSNNEHALKFMLNNGFVINNIYLDNTMLSNGVAVYNPPENGVGLVHLTFNLLLDMEKYTQIHIRKDNSGNIKGKLCFDKS